MQSVRCADDESEPSAKACGSAHQIAKDARTLVPSRTTVNFLLDSLLLAVFVALMGTAAIVRFVFPSAATAGGWQLWGFRLDDWLGLEFFLVAVLTLLIAIHLMLHWTWICGVIANRCSRWRKRSIRFDEGSQTLLGVGLLILILNLLGLLTAVASLMIRSPGT
jgi:hypothetical protein